MSISRPAHISSAPPQRTSAAFWTNNDAVTTLCTITVAFGAIVDVEAEFIMANGSTTVVLAIATGVDGFQYAMSLDEQAGTSLLQPVGLVATL